MSKEKKSKNRKPNIIYLIIKRFFDIIVSIIGIILIIPVYLIIKLCYIFTGDFSSILYYHNRIGKDGKEFRLYKFRSMVKDADKKLEELLKNDKKLAEEYRINKKIENDPRITKIGMFIRSTSIDELPQFFNVLLGQMSLIGNRPYLPKEKKDMGEYFDDIVKTKPGLSGYWQVNLRSRGTFKERLKMEQYYSNNCSLMFDFKLFFKTFSAVLGRNGAK